jgi:hypothetical protein
MTTFRLRVGKIRTTAPKYPSEPGYVAGINAQLKDLQDIFQSIIDQVEHVTPEIMLTAVMPTFQKSQIYCPFATGALRRSGFAEVVATGNQPRVEVGYAKGGNPPYAVFVHEMTSHYRRPPTRSKFLQAAMLEDIPAIRERLLADYKTFMGGESGETGETTGG